MRPGSPRRGAGWACGRSRARPPTRRSSPGGGRADWYRDDDVPWCGAFVFGQFAAALPDEPLPANPLWARGWARFGVTLSKPAPGAVLVFERGPTAGHVGFYVGEDAGRFRVLGGNQSNAVTEAWILKNRLIAIRWPATVPAPRPRRVRVAAGGATSLDEA
ncbi:TIGR02594 family protein [Chenggangzhangella methanolivorans]|uniref:TIGR02594 family protein n=1 Tax=Chenggangzhangella methanolivorans TaxID=1437009 RepID=A0A9E6UPE2_9HYPH|nr:TIGR02594 family protein [Chenggangzhangella methanolivorans]